MKLCLRISRPRCSHCGRFLGSYKIVAPAGIACPSCGPRVDGGQIQRDAQGMVDNAVR